MKQYTLISVFLLMCFGYQAQDTTASTVATDLDTTVIVLDTVSDRLDELRIVPRDTTVYHTAAQVDSLAMGQTEFLAIPDSVFIARLEKLDAESPFALDYNRHVRGILRAYLGKNSKLTARVLGLSEMYYPMFEEVLDREGLPLELKHLAVVESALRPTARSRAGATGLWQFMYGTAKENGLTITSYLDERKSPIASTEAACKYLTTLYKRYNDWNLALAAYNSGPGNVNKAIRRAGGKKDYWEIWRFLPRETRGYVPAFIAVNYVMNYYEDHGIRPIEPQFTYGECDTITVYHAMDFDQISHFTGTDIDNLRWLNPQYHRDYIPKRDGGMPLVLPIKDIGDFMANEEKIREYKKPKVSPSPAAKAYASRKTQSNYYSTEGLVKEVYTVKSGDVIGVIADRYGVGLSKLRYWNGISGSRIYPGQKLVIYRKPGHKVSAPSQATAAKKIPLDPNARYHTIRPGDTLWDIAKLYEGVSVNQIKQWNSHLNFKRLKPGQKVRVSG
ncbi:MAG: LysM peptidoglycan-binding domain-containing protein [Flavobacteriales bacterium]|nr:LysM peptidoglycan-binding domain-containing protein [Flavobacteriales bacterium]